MSDKTSIQWTDATWNPIRGCSRVSPGCEHCYAEGVAARFSGPGLPFEGLARRTAKGLPQWTGKVRLVAEKLADPLRWKRPRRIFVNSVSDLFHDDLSNEEIAAVFGAMAAAPRHTFQVLTKRPKRMRAWLDWVQNLADPPSLECAAFLLGTEPGLDGPIHCKYGPEPDAPWPLRNVWLGVSVEDQRRANERIPILLDTPAAVRFVSAEPLLEAVDLRAFRGLDWVIVGGESGREARLFDPDWARRVVADCHAIGATPFVKQMGRRPICLILKDSHGGDWDEWPEDLRVRRFPGGAS